MSEVKISIIIFLLRTLNSSNFYRSKFNFKSEQKKSKKNIKYNEEQFH